MMLQVPNVLSAEEVAACHAALESAEWIDGNLTSGAQAKLAKKNRQLVEGSPAGRECRAVIVEALGRNALFFAAALPVKIWPPLFNRYGRGERFDTHIDNAVRLDKAGENRVRTDLSATLFLTDPMDYEGGELVIEDTYGAHEVKLEAGSLILYPASSLHHVRPITHGERISSFFWVQSMVRDNAKRSLLFEMDVAIQRLVREVGNDHASIVALTGTYHNLLRQWAEV